MKYGENEETLRLFGGKESLLNFNLRSEPRIFNFYDYNGLDSIHSNSIENQKHIFQQDSLKIHIGSNVELSHYENLGKRLPENSDFKRIIKNITSFKNQFSRHFFQTKEDNRTNYLDDSKLNFNGNNLEKVLKRLLENKEKREEISEWLELFIPEFDRIEVQKSAFSRNEDLLIYQKHYKEPFNKELISDGTYNIIALLTAVYQSDEPQFLCIEEPENGLNPYVIRKLVDFFRNACAEKGHYIWLNTHSQTLVECLQPEEVIIVDKINGETQVKQIKGMNLHGLDMAEVWLSGALGGGTPW